MGPRLADSLHRGPHRHLPQRVAARIACAGDHLLPSPLDLLARHAAVLGEHGGVAVAPCFPDSSERVAVDAQRVGDDIVDADVAHAEVVEEGEGLAADVEITTD